MDMCAISVVSIFVVEYIVLYCFKYVGCVLFIIFYHISYLLFDDISKGRWGCYLAVRLVQVCAWDISYAPYSCLEVFKMCTYSCIHHMNLLPINV